MKTGQSTTSFHPATGNPIMTSTTYNRSAAYATDESKTASSSVSNGVTLGSIRGRAIGIGRGIGKTVGVSKGVGARVLRAINDLLPLSLRPIKSKRAHRKRYLGLGHRLFSFRMVWRSHYKNQILEKLGLRRKFK
jgi:hypothetical protein